MMVWLTDQPEAASAFVAPGTVWSKWVAFNSSETEQQLAAWFNPNKPAWTTCTSASLISSLAKRYVVLIESSEASQFDQMLDALKQGVDLPDGCVCLALTGARFRGQRQRPWQALRGNLHLTAHYKLDVPAREAQAGLTMLPAIASIETITGMIPCGHRVEIKWINDVLLNGAKVSGVLTATHVSGKRIERAVFGIGINVTVAPEIPATPFVPRVGCLAEVDSSLAKALPQVFAGVIGRLDELVQGLRTGHYEEIFQRYSNKARFIGEKVWIWPEGTEDWKTTALLARGKVNNMHRDLSLEIDGCEKRVRSGRLAFEESCSSMM